MKKSSKVKIVAVHLLNDRSGSPMVFARALQSLQSDGHEIDLYTSGYSEVGFLNEVSGVNRFVNAYSWSSNPLMTLFKYALNQFLLFLRCFKYFGSDVSFYLNTYLPFGAALAAFIMRKPVIYHIHETSIKPAVLKSFLKAIVKLTAKERIYVSDFLLKAEGWKHTDNQEVIYNYAHPNLTLKSESHYPAFKARSKVLMLASLKDYKGIPQFLDVARNCPGFDFELVLNAQKNEVETYMSNVDIPANLVYHPVQTELDQFYRKSHLVMNLSQPKGWVETFGLTILEAMHYGIPTIVPAVGGPLELVDQAISGYTVNTESVPDVVTAAKKILADEAVFERFSKASKKKAEQFSQHRSEAQLKEVFQCF